MSTVSEKGRDARRQSYDLLIDKVSSGRTLTPIELTAMARLEAEFADSGSDTPDHFVSAKEVAEFSGYALRTVYAAVKAGDLRRLGDDTFAYGDVVAWLETKRRRPVAGGGTEDGPAPEFNGTDEDARYRHYRARREKILVDRLEGNLLPRDEVIRQNVRRVHEFKTAIQLLSRRIDYRIAKVCGMEIKDVREIVDQEGTELLKALARKVVLHVDIS
jgi:hypothetical protein